MLSRGVRVPTPVYTDEEGGTFRLLMEALSEKDGWHQHLIIPAGPPTRAVLRWLARFHAAFLPPERGGGGLPLSTEGAWSYGSHMALEKRPASELEALPATLASFIEAFSSEDSYFGSESAASIGPRLQAVARSVAWRLRPPIDGVAGGAETVTATQGDFKQANIFFRKSEARDGTELPEVAVIDWQWTGAGVGATDLFFICVMAFADETLEDYRAGVLRPYYEELKEALGGREDGYPYEQVEREFKLAGLDFMRWITGARWAGFTPAKMAAANETVDINRGMWIRSMARLVWLWKRAAEFLDESEQLLICPK